MNIPKQIKIGGVNYDVIIDNTLQAKESVTGEIRYRETRIKLEGNLSEDAKKAALVHEIVHGILYHIANHEVNKEEFVEPFSNALHALIEDNPELFESNY